MPRPQNLLIGLSLAISAVSLLVAVVSIMYAATHRATGVEQLLGKQLPARSTSYPAPQPLTPDNPAAALPHAARVESAGGLVISISTDRMVLAPTTTPKTVVITPGTKIFQQGPDKTPEAYQKEFDAFRETLKYASGSLQTFIAPKHFEVTPLKLSSISVGDFVLIDTDGGDPAHAINVYRMHK